MTMKASPRAESADQERGGKYGRQPRRVTVFWLPLIATPVSPSARGCSDPVQASRVKVNVWQALPLGLGAFPTPWTRVGRRGSERWLTVDPPCCQKTSRDSTIVGDAPAGVTTCGTAASKPDPQAPRGRSRGGAGWRVQESRRFYCHAEASLRVSN